MPNDNSTMGERLERRKRRQEYMKRQGCMSCGHKSDHSKAWSDDNGNSVMFTHQFENPSPEDFMSDLEFIQSEISRAVGEREREIVGMIRKYSPTCGGGKCYVVEEILEKLTNQS